MGRVCLLDCSSQATQFAFIDILASLPAVFHAQGGLGFLTTTKNMSTDCPQVTLMEAVPQLRLTLPK